MKRKSRWMHYALVLGVLVAVMVGGLRELARLQRWRMREWLLRRAG